MTSATGVPQRSGLRRAPSSASAVAVAWLALGALALWGLAPVVYLLLKAARQHETLSGGDSLFASDHD